MSLMEPVVAISMTMLVGTMIYGTVDYLITPSKFEKIN